MVAARRNFFIVFGALLGWFGVVGQLYLIIINRKADLFPTLIQFISYFTILTNTIVSVYFTAFWLRPSTRSVEFFSRPSVGTAITAYILLVGLTYNTILRFIWAPEGLQKIIDEILHTVNPLYFLLFWIFFIRKTKLAWRNVWSWVPYPLIYCVYVLVRGAVTNAYPYPFMDVVEHGYQAVLINCVVVTAVFLVLALALIGVSRVAAPKV
jgi:hypothetical protein